LRSGSRSSWSCHVAGPSRNVKGNFFLTKSALRAAVASCAVGEAGVWTDYEVLLHGTPELSTFAEGEHFHGDSAMASRRFSATDIREFSIVGVPLRL
jgi:hypothetical protein